MSIQIKSLTSGEPVKDHPGIAPLATDHFNLIPTANEVYSLYTATTGKSAIVKSLRFVNTHTAAVTLTLYFNRPDSSMRYRRRLLAPADISLPAGFTYIDDSEITLEPGDKIQAKADTANVIQYVISGVERDET